MFSFQYNNLEFDESGKPDEVVLDKVVLDFDPETKEPLIEVDKGLVKKLKPHQVLLSILLLFDYFKISKLKELAFVFLK